jgi:peroxiredoxin
MQKLTGMFHIKKYLPLTLVAFLLAAKVVVAEGYQIKLSLPRQKDTRIYLASYYGNRIFRIDSTQTDQHGNATLAGDSSLDEGFYLLYLDKDHYFDFLVGKDQTFSVSAGFQNIENQHFSGAPETGAFQKYQQFLGQQRKIQMNLQQEMQQYHSNTDSVKQIRNRMMALNQEMQKYWEEQADKYKGTFYADFMRFMIIPRPDDIKVPANVANPDSVKWTKEYAFRRDHFWDNFNFAQPGLIRTPLVQNRLDTYFDKVLIQNPDSIIGPAKKLIEKSKANDNMFRFMADFVLTHSANSQVMGMDKVFVQIADAYFLNGKASWADSTMLSKIRKKVYVTRPNLLGKIAPELKLQNADGQYFSLHQVDAKYTILYFWEPGCNHCKEQTPVLYDKIYKKLHSKGVEVYAVLTQPDEKTDWQKFIDDHGLYDWINVWDPDMISNFHTLYDVHSTPTLYILDKNKKIIAKRLDVTTASDLLEKLLKYH